MHTKLITSGLALVLVTGIAALVANAAPAPDSDNLFHRPADFDVENHPGRGLYLRHCATCHEGGVAKAPHRQFLEAMPPRAIVESLTRGAMKQEAEDLDSAQKRQVAEYLTRIDLASYEAPPGPPACEGEADRFDLTRPPARAGWGYDTRRFVPTAAAGLTARDIPGLELKWAFAFPDALRARSQPVVAMGAIFVGSQDGTLYAFDLETGCARWTSNVGAEVRTAVVVEPWSADQPPEQPPRLFFGDLLGRAYAMDALTGQVLWRTRVDDHPNATITGTPLLQGSTLYVPVSSLEVTPAASPDYPCCTFRGSLVALDVASGDVRWRHYTVRKPPARQGQTAVATPILGPSGAAVWTSPTYDGERNLIYHGSGQNYSLPADDNSDAVFAVDPDTGERRWHQQVTENDVWTPACALKTPNCTGGRPLDFDIASSILLVETGNGRQVLVAGQKSGAVFGLDPDAGGKVLWQRQVGRGSLMGGVHFGMAAEGNRIYVPIADLAMQGDGTMAEKPGAPGLHALDAATGNKLWQAGPRDNCEPPECSPGISAAVTAMPGIVFAGHLDGKFRAYDGATGRVVWQTDTTRPVMAVNGIEARGGSMSGPGAAIADGHVIVNSGYAYAMFQPGNALLVYAPADKEAEQKPGRQVHE